MERSADEWLAGSAAADLRIYLLGSLRVEWAGRPFAIPRRQVRALLCRLAARPHPVPRGYLGFLFWPDVPESTASRNLSRLLNQLRRALPAPELLLAQDDHVGLDSWRAWSDTAAFERLCGSPAPAPPGKGRPGGEGEDLQQAVDLYRGPFLSGFSLPESPEFETWMTLEREAWEHLYLKALAALIEERSTSGEHAAAIACAQRYLATDDLAEDVHRRLIELYGAAGDRGAAQRQFERCVATLERELRVGPLPETRAAYHAALEGRTSPQAAAAPAPRWTTLPGLAVPLVGRDDALRMLHEAYAGARGGRGGMVLVSGEPGVGKSRLVQDFATRLRSQALVLAGAGRPETHTLPYQPLVEALRPALAARDSLPGVQPTWLAEAARLLPELGEICPDLPPPLPDEPGEARARLFEALYRLVVGLAADSRTTLLCLDDLHWADAATLNWLAYLGRYLRDGRLLVVGAYRSEEARVVAGLRHGMARHGALSELAITGLDAAAISRILQHVGDALPDPLRAGGALLADRLQQVTGGNPFFLLETLRGLIESGQRLDDLPDLQDLPLPDTVRDAVEARVQSLGLAARQVLEAGAVLGQAFPFDVVQQTAGRGEMETADALDELVARHLLVEQPAGHRFRHTLVREVVYQRLGHRRRQLLHRRAAGALLRSRGDDPAAGAELAHHYHQAGQPAQAIRAAIRAGEHACRLYAVEQAAAHFERAIAWAGEAGLALDAEQLAAIHVNWGDALQRSGRHEEALSHYAAVPPSSPAPR